jgi:peptidoglycan hydrolase-like protein with peptidoglycan-binding domain
MVQAMYDGLYKTGQVGTEQFWAAVENLVPTEVYQGLKEDSDRMKAIYDYYNKKILPSLHLEEDQFSMDYASIENFVKKAIDAKVFTGDRKDFDLVEGMNLEKAAELMDMTTAQAYAFFAELDKYNTSSTEQSFLSQLDDSLEGKISNVTTKLQDLNQQKLVFLEDKSEITEELEKLGAGGSVDLTARPVIDSQELIDAGWNTQAGQIATVFTSTFSDKTGNIAINFTPILTDELGNRTGVLSPKELQEYAEGVVEGVHNDHLKLQIGAKFEGEDAIKNAEDAAEHIHELHEDYVGLDGTIDEINADIADNNDELNKVGKSAYEMWQSYTKNEAALAALSEINDKQRLLTEDEANTLGIKWDEVSGKTVQGAIDYLLGEKLKLEEPTVLTAQLAIENIDTQIAELKGKIEQINQNTSIRPNIKEAKTAELEAQIQKLEEDKVTIATTFGIELSEEDKKGLEDELNAIEKFKIHDKEFTVVAKGTSEVMRLLEAVNQYAKDVTKTVTTEYKTVYTSDNKQYSGWTHTPGSGGRYTHADGTAHATGSWGAPRTETALVGELGPELLVRNGRWHTIGENGAEFTQVQRGDIIFNHKQTEDLLSKGYVTGRGKLQGGSSAFASGTAYSGLWRPTSPNVEQSNKPGRDFSIQGNKLYDAADALSSAADSISGASDEFKEVFDWIEVRLEEINEDIDLESAKLENKAGYKKQNESIAQLIKYNQQLHDNLQAAKGYYETYAAKLLGKVDSKYKNLAKKGAIDIDVFKGEIGEKQLEAIKEYREWVQKAADVTQQAEETLTEISTLAKQAIDNISEEFENKASLRKNKTDQLDAYNALLETTYGVESEKIYEALKTLNQDNRKMLEQQKAAMQQELNTRVQSGEIQKYSQDWYDAVNAIAELDTQIIELKADFNDLQDSINEIRWYHFDLLMSQLESVSDEAESLIDILTTKDVTDEMGNWTDEGVTALGLYAQQMEVAQRQAEEYDEQIKYLNANWKKLGYTEEEYLDKLDELKDGQYDAIKAYHDSKDAIVDLNKERVDAIKEGIEKETDALEKLIEKKKEELDAEQDLYGFQQKVRESTKSIDDLERQLSALSSDNSASARARRAQLEAELAEAKQDLEDQYYERSVSNQQEALDKKLENFKAEKDAEIEGWEEYLEDAEKVVNDSLQAVQSNTDTVLQTLNEMGQEYSLNITDSLTSPWKSGSVAISDYKSTFGTAVSETMDMLDGLSAKYDEVSGDLVKELGNQGSKYVGKVENNANEYVAANKNVQQNSSASSNGTSNSTNTAPSTAGMVSNISGTIYQGQTGDRVKKLQQALNALGYNCGNVDGKFGPKTLAAVKQFQKAMGLVVDGRVGPKTKAKFKLKGYAVGSKGVAKDQWALIDELGEELQLVPDGNGRLAYIKKGTGILTSTMTERLMDIAMNPQMMIDQNRPNIGVPHITNNEINVHMDIAEVVHIDKVTNDTIPNLTKEIEKQMDSYMVKVNNSLKKFVR